MAEKQLLEVVRSFGKLDSLVTLDPVPPELDAGRDRSKEIGQSWKPIRIDTDAAALELVYRGLRVAMHAVGHVRIELPDLPRAERAKPGDVSRNAKRPNSIAPARSLNKIGCPACHGRDIAMSDCK